MKLSFQQIHGYLQDPLSKLVFLLIGDDAGQIIHATNQLIDKYFAENTYNIERLDFSCLEKDSSFLSKMLRSRHLFGNKKALIIKNIGNNIKKEVLKVIEDNPNNYLLVLQGDNLKKNCNTYKWIQNLKDLTIINCYKLDYDARNQFIESFLRNHNIKLDKDILCVINNSLPDDLLIIQNELDKLIIFLGKEKVLSIDIIRKIISWSRDLIPMELLHSILLSHRENFIKNLNKIEDHEPNTIVNLLQSSTNKLLLAKIREEFLNINPNFVTSMAPIVFFKEKKIFSEIYETTTIESILKLSEELISLERLIKAHDSTGNKLIINQFLLEKFFSRSS